MEDADFSDAFCRFIQKNIPSVEAAELLLALHGLGPDASVDEAEAVRLREMFRVRGLYAPLQEEHRPYVELLSRAYRERPVTLVRIIYALRDTKIQSFAEAFRLRRR